MSDGMIKILIGAALLLHGLGHGGAFGALLWIRQKGEGTAGSWQKARSWLFPTLRGSAATTVASVFWILSLIGFVAASLSFWGVFVPGELWRQLAVASAVPSTLGIVLFFGTWPMFNTLAALGMNIAVFVTLLWLHWPPKPMFGI